MLSPELLLSLDTPADNPPLTDRLPLDAVVHNETYVDYSVDCINKLFAEKENLETTKDIIKTNELDNLAQVFVLKRYPKKDNIHFSNVYLDVIDKQGFMNNL